MIVWLWSQSPNRMLQSDWSYLDEKSKKNSLTKIKIVDDAVVITTTQYEGVRMYLYT